MQILNPSSGQNTNKAEGSAFYPLDKCSKTVTALSTENQNKHRFALGSFENSESNKIQLVDFDEESFTFSQVTVVDSLLPVDHLLNFYSTEKVTQLLVSFKDLSNKGSYLCVLTVDTEKSKDSNTNNNKENKINKNLDKVRRVSVDPHSSLESNRFTAVTRDSLYLFQNFQEVLSLKTTKQESDKYSRSFYSGKFDPHNKDLFAISTDNYFEVVDFRQDNSKRLNVKGTSYHKGTILDLDYNPNLPNELVTTGEDALLLFWDLRNTNKPLTIFDSGHRHWVNRVEYNSFQDQLLLTCGAGGSVLHRKQEQLQKLAEKSSSCYDLCWSYDDAWFYSVLVSNGLRVETVPKSVKNSLLT